MVRICTGEVWVRSSRRSRDGLCSCPAMSSVSCVSRAGWFGGKVERLEVVVVGLDLGPLADGIAHRLEDGDDLVHHAQDGMLHADGAMDAGKGDVEALGGEQRVGGRGMDFVVGALNCRFRASLQLVDAAADFALCRTGRGFQPNVIDLSEDAVLARQPAVAKGFPVSVGMERGDFPIEGGEQIADGAVERFRRVIFEFGNGVHEMSCQIVIPTDGFSRSGGPCGSNAKVCAAPEGAQSSK
jgi:hypothetical protein